MGKDDQWGVRLAVVGKTNFNLLDKVPSVVKKFAGTLSGNWIDAVPVVLSTPSLPLQKHMPS